MNKHKLVQMCVTTMTCLGVFIWFVMPDNAMAMITVGSLTNLLWVWLE